MLRTFTALNETSALGEFYDCNLPAFTDINDRKDLIFRQTSRGRSSSPDAQCLEPE